MAIYLQVLYRSVNYGALQLPSNLQKSCIPEHLLDPILSSALLQFIKECSSQTAGADASTPGTPKWNPTMTPNYLKVFDPRCVRAAGSGPNAQAEVVTGTHLYAYLHDQELPPALVLSKRSIGCDKGASHAEIVYSSNDARGDAIKEMFLTAELFSGYKHVTDGYNKQYEDFSVRSLLQEIKAAKDVFMKAFYLTHDTISAEMTAATQASSGKLSQSQLPQLTEKSLQSDLNCVTNVVGIVSSTSARVLSADDVLLTNFSLALRHSESNGNALGATLEGSCESSDSVCLASAVLTAAVVSSIGVPVKDGTETRLDLVVLCRSLSGTDCSGDVTYCARVSLTPAETSTSRAFRIGGVYKMKMYIGHPTMLQRPADTFLKSPEEGEEGEDAFNRLEDSCDDNSSIVDEGRDRTAAVVLLGPEIVRSGAEASPSTSLPSNSCLSRIDLKDLRFYSVTPRTTPGEVSSGFTARSSSSSSSQSLNVNALLDLRAQTIGTDDGQVPVRERLLSLDFQQDRSRIILEACAPRGVVLVGISSDGVAGGKAIVVDMEVDDEIDEDDDDDDEDLGIRLGPDDSDVAMTL
jgi:hypothetical protein